jgi:hypothetical protein
LKKKKKIDYSKQGKRNLAAGRRFENKVRLDLESKGWIVSKWQNNVELKEEKVQVPCPDNKPGCCVMHFEKKITGKCIQAKQGRFRKTSTGFPDFIAYRNEYLWKREGRNQFGDMIGYGKEAAEIIFVECKSNGYLSKEEKEKAQWYLKNKYCSKFFIAKKGKKRGEIEYIQFV